jgi:hypothetical protein
VKQYYGIIGVQFVLPLGPEGARTTVLHGACMGGDGAHGWSGRGRFSMRWATTDA